MAGSPPALGSRPIGIGVGVAITSADGAAAVVVWVVTVVAAGAVVTTGSGVLVVVAVVFAAAVWAKPADATANRHGIDPKRTVTLRVIKQNLRVNAKKWGNK
ncbi:MAG: hypothetical protein M3Y56_16830 [Armatimonadota bacterium]|nr:hypothetical protein [Armatimonadota bacterium]